MKPYLPEGFTPEDAQKAADELRQWGGDQETYRLQAADAIYASDRWRDLAKAELLEAFPARHVLTAGDPYRPEAPTLRWLWVITLAGLVIAAVLAYDAMSAGQAGATSIHPNDPAHYESPTRACWKHEGLGGNVHGTATGGTVTLNPFDPNWTGDHWALLVVKGGDDRNVYELPEAGVAYSTPLNNGGQVPDVSHWIVCKGTTPETTTTEPPVTTTVPETTTTTTPPVGCLCLAVQGACPPDCHDQTSTTLPDRCELATVDPECHDHEQTPPPPSNTPTDPTPLPIPEKDPVVQPELERTATTLPVTGPSQVGRLLDIAAVLITVGVGLAFVAADNKRRRA